MRRSTMLMVVLALTLAPGSASAATSALGPSPSRSTTLAVIGDTPYDDAQLADFPGLVAPINADRDVRAVVHLGDIKSGQPCTDDFFRGRLALFDTFADPFVFTPGDNDWTDCHRPQFGAFAPTERLASLRRIFYPHPDRALGGRPALAVRPQSRDRGFTQYVENVMWARSRAVFATIHVVGSNNDLVPWFDGAETPAQRALRMTEFGRRVTATVAWVERAFEQARRIRARGVVIAMQANIWLRRLEPDADVSGFDTIVQSIATRAKRFGGKVLLLQGDTHKYLADRPLKNGSPEHGVQAPRRRTSRASSSRARPRRSGCACASGRTRRTSSHGSASASRARPVRSARPARHSRKRGNAARFAQGLPLKAHRTLHRRLTRRALRWYGSAGLRVARFGQSDPASRARIGRGKHHDAAGAAGHV